MSSKPSLILLHGALGSSAQMKPFAKLLSTDFDVHVPNFYGHGGNDPGDREFTMQGFANQLGELVSSLDDRPAYIFGYSMGGFVALYYAASHPGVIQGIFTLATKFNWSEEEAREETAMLVPETMMAKVPAFVDELQARHAPVSWQKVVTRTAEFMMELGADPEILAKIKTTECKVRLAVGDRDKMAGVEATVAMYRQLKNATLQVLPATPHPFEKTDITFLAAELRRFIRS